MAVNYKELFKEKWILKQQLLKVNPELNNKSGIYIFTRFENNFKYAYIGQAKHLIDRLVDHLQGFEQWIDLSIRKHGLISEKNPTGWQIKFINAEEKDLDDLEFSLISDYANAGYQLRNKTSGSQGKGKFGIESNKDSRGYRVGVKDGYLKAINEIAPLFNKYLTVAKLKDNKLCERALVKFKNFISGGKINERK